MAPPPGHTWHLSAESRFSLKVFGLARGGAFVGLGGQGAVPARPTFSEGQRERAVLPTAQARSTARSLGA